MRRYLSLDALAKARADNAPQAAPDALGLQPRSRKSAHNIKPEDHAKATSNTSFVDVTPHSPVPPQHPRTRILPLLDIGEGGPDPSTWPWTRSRLDIDFGS